MSDYIQRALGPFLLKAPAKVVILEGARAVGKTSLVKQQLASKHTFHYETLTDPNTLRLALEDPFAWVASLPTPTIIDEAQLAPNIFLAVKERVDATSSPTPLFILTGSASMTNRALGGQNPLTRRSVRLTLYPLTQDELSENGNSTSIVDKLWYQTPNENYRSPLTRERIRQMASVGGFPRYAVELPEFAPTMSESERNLLVRNDIVSVLGDTLLPDERLDGTIAQAVLDSLLAHPGEILNVSRIASELNYNVKTVERYMSILINRFLVYTLPNLNARPGKQTFTRAKIHPVDTSFSTEILSRSARTPLELSPKFGGVLESFVANQIIPAAQWSSVHPNCYYWREAGKAPREVDIVLVRDSELIGIEVKAAASVTDNDFRGLKALRKDARFTRGFVVYTGNRIIRHDKDLWALPVSALWERDTFLGPSNNEPSSPLSPAAALNIPSRPEQTTVDANVFLSYAHIDDEHINGAITHLARAIAEEYQFQFASALRLFIDKESINWGEDWRKAIRQSIDGTNFLLTAVTPRYLTRPECRDELLQFMGQLEERSSGAILSLVWQDISPMRGTLRDDPVLQAISRHQMLSVEDLQDLDPGSATYRKRVKEIVAQLRRTIEKDRAHESESSEPQPTNTPTEGVIEAANRVNDLMPEMMESMNSLQDNMNRISDTTKAYPVPKGGDPKALLIWSKTLADATDTDVRSLKDDVTAVSAGWNELYIASRSYVDLLASLPDGDQKRGALSGFLTTLSGLRSTLTVSAPMDEGVAMMRILPALSPRLRPLSSAFDSVLKLLGSMSSMVDSLIEQTRAAF